MSVLLFHLLVSICLPFSKIAWLNNVLGAHNMILSVLYRDEGPRREKHTAVVKVVNASLHDLSKCKCFHFCKLFKLYKS